MTKRRTRYRVDKDTHSGGGPFELEEKTTFKVVDKTTGEVLHQFVGESDASFSRSGGGWKLNWERGASEVTVDEAAGEVVVKDVDGSVSRVPLRPVAR